jgi:hypothetical protein
VVEIIHAAKYLRFQILLFLSKILTIYINFWGPLLLIFKEDLILLVGIIIVLIQNDDLHEND